MSISELRALLDEVPDTRELILREAPSARLGRDHAAWSDAHVDAEDASRTGAPAAGGRPTAAYRAAQDREDAAQDALASSRSAEPHGARAAQVVGERLRRELPKGKASVGAAAVEDDDVGRVVEGAALRADREGPPHRLELCPDPSRKAIRPVICWAMMNRRARARGVAAGSTETASTGTSRSRRSSALRIAGPAPGRCPGRWSTGRSRRPGRRVGRRARRAAVLVAQGEVGHARAGGADGAGERRRRPQRPLPGVVSLGQPDAVDRGRGAEGEGREGQGEPGRHAPQRAC